MDNHRSKEKLTKIITEKPELLQNLNISPRKLFLFVEHLENNNVVVREEGEWVPGDSIVFPIWKCSLCGIGFITGQSNFCPNCGADMREGGNGCLK